MDQGHRVRRLRWYAGQRNLLDLDMARNGSRYGFTLHLPQSQTETLLRARVQELGGIIEHGVELVRLAERGDAVDATLRDAAGREIQVSAGVGRYAEFVDVVGGDLRSGFALVRPDGILAARGSARDAHRVVDYLHRLCGPSEPEPGVDAVRSEVSGQRHADCVDIAGGTA